MEWQHRRNQLLGRFGLAVGWNKKNSPQNLGHVISIVFFEFEIEIASADGINQFLFKSEHFDVH